MNEPTELMMHKRSERIYQESIESVPSLSSLKLPFSASELKGDLDNIILTALRKEPERRYTSVEDLSKDISNYLNELPVTARPNTFFYRASKFYLRNKTASIVGIFLVLSLIAGIIATTWQAIIANKERDRAEKRFQDVRKLSNSLLFEITPKIERLQGSTEAREILVNRALNYLDSLAAESEDDLSLQSELASAYEKIGELQANPHKPSLNNILGAIESYQKAKQIRLKLPQTTENQQLLAENLRQYSDIIYSQNDVKGSLEVTNNALDIYVRLLAENPQSYDFQMAYIQTKMELGATYSTNNQYNEAIPVFQKAINELAQLDSNNQEVQRQTALALAQLGNALSWDGKQPEAEAEMTKAVKIIEHLAEKNPNDSLIRRNTFKIYSLSSSIYEEVKNDISLDFAQKAVQTATRMVEADAADLQAKSLLASSFSRVGISLVNVGQISQAIDNLQQAESLYRDLVAQEPKILSYQRSLGVLYLRIGDAETKQNNFSEALKNYQKSADMLETIATMDEKNTLARRDAAQSLKNVGITYLKLNQPVEAKRTFKKALEILDKLNSQNSLGEFDKKMIEEMQNYLQKLEN